MTRRRQSRAAGWVDAFCCGLRWYGEAGEGHPGGPGARPTERACWPRRTPPTPCGPGAPPLPRAPLCSALGTAKGSIQGEHYEPDSALAPGTGRMSQTGQSNRSVNQISGRVPPGQPNHAWACRAHGVHDVHTSIRLRFRAGPRTDHLGGIILVLRRVLDAGSWPWYSMECAGGLRGCCDVFAGCRRGGHLPGHLSVALAVFAVLGVAGLKVTYLLERGAGTRIHDGGGNCEGTAPGGRGVRIGGRSRQVCHAVPGRDRHG